MIYPVNYPQIVIALCSDNAQAGKTTVAKCIKQKYPTTSVIESFAAPMKDMIEILLYHTGLPDDYVDTRFESENKDKPIGVRALGERGSIRYLMQTLGTQWGRELINKNIWTDIMDQKIKQHFQHGLQFVIIDDMRFPNEAEMLEKYRAHVIYIEGVEARKKYHHASETYAKAIEHEFYIDNTEYVDLDMLYRKVDDIVIEIVDRELKRLAFLEGKKDVLYERNSNKAADTRATQVVSSQMPRSR
jgi:hypothetical protein